MSRPQIDSNGIRMYVEGARGVFNSATLEHLFKGQEVAIGYLLALEHLLEVMDNYHEIVDPYYDAESIKPPSARTPEDF